MTNQSDLLTRDLVAGRIALLQRILAAFTARGVVAIYQFGSLATTGGDALSDLDIWIVANDADLPGLIQDRDQLYSEISPVLLKHEAPQNSPLSGKYSLVLHQTANALYQVDYYLAPLSTSVILPEAKVLVGADTLPRGTWRLSEEPAAHETLSQTVDFMIAMAFIGVKKTLRHDGDFLEFLFACYDSLRETDPRLTPIANDGTLNAIGALLSALTPLANNSQQAALDAIARHLAQVRPLFA